MYSLYQAILSRDHRNHAKHGFYGKPVTLLSPFEELLSYVEYMPFKVRKFLLDACRIQRSCYVNSTLLSSLNTLLLSRDATFFAPHATEKTIHVDQIATLFDHLYDNPVLCSVLSYFVRAETTRYRQEFLLLKEESITKEISASIDPPRPQQLSYSIFLDGEERPVHNVAQDAAIAWKTVRTLKKNVSQIIHRFTHSTHIFFPQYNGKKSVSYETQVLLYNSLRLSLERQPVEVTTLDLLKHYARTGEMIQGPLELRQSWKFSDLKPRTYYCLGGKAYWDSLYIKDIAKAFQQLLPCTDPFSRFDTSRIGVIDDHSLFITYDYTSFTTSLSELRFYLDHLSLLFDDVVVKVVDVFSGIQEIDLGQYIRDYNQHINVNQEYSLERLMNSIREEDNRIRQCRNGSLGVPGNIGFSTACHGLSISSFTNTPDEDSIVGDDAAMRVMIVQLAVFMQVVNVLGEVHPEKFKTIPRPSLYEPREQDVQSFKYLKRPCTVDFDGKVALGRLDSFPNIALLHFPNGDGIHSQTVKTTDSAIRTFCMQWGRFLTANHLSANVLDYAVEEDVVLLLQTIQSVYHKYELPLHGSYPGGGVYSEYNIAGELVKRPITFWMPPADGVGVFGSPWMEQLYIRFVGHTISMPVDAGTDVPAPRDIVIGGRYTVTDTCPELRLLQALGYVEMEMILVPRLFNESLRMEVEEFMSNGLMENKCMYEMTVVDVPFWYVDVFDVLYPEDGIDGNVDPLEVASSFGMSVM
jgi:hypothetical protein